MTRKKDSIFLISMGIVFLLMVSVPYLWAYQITGSEHQFGGFLLNPIDGNSYLAKMYQGWQGNWRFYLPYTSQPGTGGYLFLFYLALGQIARLVSGSLQTIFHLSRLIGSVALVISLWHFYSQVLSTKRSRRIAFGLALFGSGLGWIAALFGLFTADFWVAEGYPFLSAYANPHFPLGMAILLWILTPNLDNDRKGHKAYGNLTYILLVFSALILGIILPFGVVVAAVVLAGLALWELFDQTSPLKRKEWGREKFLTIFRDSATWRNLFLVLLGGLPILIYEVWITRADPVLAAWNEQNLTASPMIWDLIISFSPVMLLAIPGGYMTWKDKKVDSRTLLLWAGLGFLLLYFPWGLQRRFILGYMIPISGLAAIGLDQLISKNRRIAFVVVSLVILLILPTNMMIILGGIRAVQIREPKLLLSQEEVDGLNWLTSNSNQDALVMASPQMGLFIPAYTGRRVLYGHPFETVKASEMETAVVDFLSGSNFSGGNPHYLDYIFYGSRERELGELNIGPEYKIVYSSGDMQIFEVKNQ
jgi:hypothetical protein